MSVNNLFCILMNHTFNCDTVAHRIPYVGQNVDEEKMSEMRESRAKEVKMWTILKEIMTYLFYVSVICTLSYDNRDINAFRAKDEIAKIFVTQGNYHHRVNIKFFLCI